jgi:hypothetical protein
VSTPAAVLPPGEHLDLLLEAIEIEGRAQRLLLGGDWNQGRTLMREASGRYRASWELAPPRSFGRLVGMLKAAVIGGDASDAAAYASRQGADLDSPTAAYAAALIALIGGDDGAAKPCAAAMRSGSEAFSRAADAIDAVVDRDQAAYVDSIAAITRDFESRDAYLTGVAIADTAVMFEEFARERGLAADLSSPVLPRPRET